MLHSIAKRRYLDEESARFYFQQIVSAVHYMHTHAGGLVHRDLKLENVKVTSAGICKLLDFGFARHTGSLLKTAVGTIEYMPPELFRLQPGQRYDGCAVDVWAMGVMLFVMVSGGYPFDKRHEPSGFEKRLKGEHAPLPTRISPSCKDLIRRMLTGDPALRIKIPDIMRHPWCTTSQAPTTPPLQAPVTVLPQQQVAPVPAAPVVPVPLGVWPLQEFAEPGGVQVDHMNFDDDEDEEMSDEDDM